MFLSENKKSNIIKLKKEISSSLGSDFSILDDTFRTKLKDYKLLDISNNDLVAEYKGPGSNNVVDIAEKRLASFRFSSFKIEHLSSVNNNVGNFLIIKLNTEV